MGDDGLGIPILVARSSVFQCGNSFLMFYSNRTKTLIKQSFSNKLVGTPRRKYTQQRWEPLLAASGAV